MRWGSECEGERCGDCNVIRRCWEGSGVGALDGGGEGAPALGAEKAALELVWIIGHRRHLDQSAHAARSQDVRFYFGVGGGQRGAQMRCAPAEVSLARLRRPSPFAQGVPGGRIVKDWARL